MATQVLDGVGEIQLRHATAGLFAGGYANVEITGESNKADGKRRTTAGKLIVSDSRITEETYTLTLTQETHDFRGFELAMGYRGAVEATADYYELKEATVPTSAPYEISVAGELDDAVTDGLMVSIFANGSWNLASGTYSKLDLAVITTGTVAAGQALFDDTTPGSEKLVFHSSQAGAPVVYSYKKTATSKFTVGLNIDTALTSFVFSAKLISDEFPNGVAVVAPSVSKTSLFSYSSSDDIPVITHELTIGTAAGFSFPFYLIEL